MNRIIKSAIAFLAVAALPLVATAPASATSSWGSLEFDCGNELGLSERSQFPLFSPTVTVTLYNCDNLGVGDAGDTGNAFLESSLVDNILFNDIVTNPATMTITGPVELTFSDGGFIPGTLTFGEVEAIPDPADSTLLSTSTAEIPTDVQDFSYGNETQINDDQEIQISDGCYLIAGQHVYSTATLDVSEYGNYTMRVVGQDPSGELVHQDDSYSPWDDSLIFVYSEFDPMSIDSNLVGCGDQIWPDDLGLNDYNWYKTEDGQPLSEMWPYFDMELDPGTYTLVYLTYETLSSSEWASGTDAFGTWEPGAQSITTELWGPANGATLQSESEKAAAEALASTGVDPSFGIWAGLGLVGTGAAIAVARRRSQRA